MLQINIYTDMARFEKPMGTKWLPKVFYLYFEGNLTSEYVRLDTNTVAFDLRQQLNPEHSTSGPREAQRSEKQQ